MKTTVYVVTTDKNDRASGNVVGVYAEQQRAIDYIEEHGYAAITEWIPDIGFGDGDHIKRMYNTPLRGVLWVRIIPYNVQS